MIDAIFVRGPILFLEDAIRQKRLFEGVVVSVSYLEHFGIVKLKKYYDSQNIPTGPMHLDRLPFPSIMAKLENCRVINGDIRQLALEVNKERNHIVHELLHPDTLDEPKAEETIQKAILCLKALGIN